MVTRGLLGFVRKDRSRRGCRQQFDTYPTGLGQRIVDFLKTLKKDEFDVMAERVDAIHWKGPRDIPKDLEVVKSYVEQGFASGDYSYCYIDRYYDYSDPATTYGALLVNLNCHASIALTPIKEGRLCHLIDQTEWEDDDYCEWSYWLDFHSRTVEIKGYNISSIVSFDALLNDSQWMEKCLKRHDDINMGLDV